MLIDMQRASLRFLLILLLSIFWVPTAALHAQGINLNNTQGQTLNTAALTVSPSYHEPFAVVTLSINDYSINTSGATITWLVNGSEYSEGSNQRSIDVQLGELGSKTTVQAVMQLPGGGNLSLDKTLQPVRVDMLVEADTLTPAFYQGRSLPTNGSVVRVTALPFMGTDTSPQQYSYRWKVGNQVIGGGAQFGKNNVDFVPGFGVNEQVSVDVINSEGKTVASRSIIVPITEPELYFYEDNPLRGLQTTAISDTYIFVNDEIQIRAEPYYINSTLLSQNPHIEWKLNNRSISNQNDNPQQITLRKEGNRGSFSLEFHIRNLEQLLQGVKEKITITF